MRIEQFRATFLLIDVLSEKGNSVTYRFEWGI